MELIDIRNEVLAKGFDPTLFGIARVNQYINDGYSLICRRVQYYVDEATQDFSTAVGTTNYALPTDFARVRELRDTTRGVIQPVGLRQIDATDSAQNGPPVFYALDAANVHLWPTPDGVYSLELRYWKMPTPLVQDTDVPNLPLDWHHLLWVYGCWQCYESEDDASMGQYWMNRFNTELAEFSADAKFPSTDFPSTARGMWESDAPLEPRGWSVWGWV